VREKRSRRAQSYAVLRQRYLTGGEALLNNWNMRFLETRAATSSQRRRESRAGRVLKRGTKAGAKGGAGSEGKAGEGEEAADGQARSGSSSGTRGGTLRAPRWASQLRSILDVTSQARAHLGALLQQSWVADAGCRWGACSPGSAVCRAHVCSRGPAVRLSRSAGVGSPASSAEEPGRVRPWCARLRAGPCAAVCAACPSAPRMCAQMDTLTEELGGGEALGSARGGQMSPAGPLTAAMGRMQRISSNSERSR